MPFLSLTLVGLLLGGLLLLRGVVLPDLHKERVGLRVLHHLHYCVVEGILVLLQPVGHVVAHLGLRSLVFEKNAEKYNISSGFSRILAD